MADKVKGPHEELTYLIIGAAMAVHRRIGPGQKEAIYQRTLEAQLESDLDRDTRIRSCNNPCIRVSNPCQAWQQ